MQHTIRQSSNISSCTHKISENTTIKTNGDTNIRLKEIKIVYKSENQHVKLSDVQW